MHPTCQKKVSCNRAIVKYILCYISQFAVHRNPVVCVNYFRPRL